MGEAERQQTARSEEELTQVIQKLKAELGSGDGKDDDELELEEVPFTHEDLRTLSEEEMRQKMEVLIERLELAKKHKDLDRRAINLGLLRVANRSPRCSHVKDNGRPCAAPALRDRLFCIFHSRALETEERPKIKVRVLENRESLQLTVKQIMEQIVSGRIDTQSASLLLRALQIANSAIKPKKVRVARHSPKSAPVEPASDWGNPKESSG